MSSTSTPNRTDPPPFYSASPKRSSSQTFTSNTVGSTVYQAKFDAYPAQASEAWVEVTPGKFVSHSLERLDSSGSDLREGHVPQAWYKGAQRTLKTIILVGIVMACVSAQILSFAVASSPSLEHTLAICFAVVALFFTTLSAMYSAVTYAWLRPEWTPHATKFDEWVSSSTSAMVVWSWAGLVIGVYSDFLAVVCFLFAIMHHTLATILTCIFAVASVSPMVWGLYRWQGLYTQTLVWKPRLNGPTVVSARKADRFNHV